MTEGEPAAVGRRPEAAGRRGSEVALLGLIVFVGANLRTVVLGVPPVLPLVQRDLGLSYTETGLLTSLPMLVFALAAWPSGLLVHRFGGRAVVAFGLAALALGSTLRAATTDALTLYALTALLSLGVALAQTAMPPLARHWFPTRIGLIAALFTDGLIFGEALAVVVTTPLMDWWLGHEAWRATFVVWAVPVLLALALWLWLTPAEGRDEAEHAPSTPAARSGAGSTAGNGAGRGSGDGAQPTSAPHGQATEGPGGARRKAAPFPRGLALQLGVLAGAGSLIYFGMNGWIPPYNAALGLADMTPLALGLLNSVQLPVTLGLTLVAQRIVGQRWPFVVVGALCLAGITGWLAMPAAWQPVWAGLLGGASSCSLLLGIALPPILAPPGQAARLTGATLLIGYAVAFFGPLAGGRLWDLFGQPGLAFAPVVCASVALIALGALLPERRPHP